MSDICIDYQQQTFSLIDVSFATEGVHDVSSQCRHIYRHTSVQWRLYYEVGFSCGHHSLYGSCRTEFHQTAYNSSRTGFFSFFLQILLTPPLFLVFLLKSVISPCSMRRNSRGDGNFYVECQRLAAPITPLLHVQEDFEHSSGYRESLPVTMKLSGPAFHSGLDVRLYDGTMMGCLVHAYRILD